MTHPNAKFLRSVGTLIGGIVGVGVFGLPYAFAQSGPALGLLVLLILGVLMGVLLLMYGQIIAYSGNQHRLVGQVRHYLGKLPSWAVTLFLFASLWGTMVAYMIVGGRFLWLIASPFLPLPESFYSYLVALLAAALIWRGLRFVARLEVGVIAVLVFMFLFVILACLPHLQAANLAAVSWPDFLVPYGVALFALSGLGVVPEVAQVLGEKQRRLLPLVLVLGLAAVVVLYAVFAVVVVGVTGAATTEVAFAGLVPFLGRSFSVVGSLLGTVTILSIFTVLGLEMLNTFKYDFKLPHRAAWLATVVVPVGLFALGIREFIDLIGFIGGVFSALLGVIVVITYEKVKRRSAADHGVFFRVPTFVSVILIAVFLLGAVLEIASLK